MHAKFAVLNLNTEEGGTQQPLWRGSATESLHFQIRLYLVALIFSHWDFQCCALVTSGITFHLSILSFSDILLVQQVPYIAVPYNTMYS